MMKDLRIVFLADTHLGFDYPIKPRVERRRRGPDFFANFRWVLNYARQTRPDLVLHGGDLFFRARVPQKIIDLVYDDLLDFAGDGIPFVIVPGNHERSILPASLFLNHPSIYIFDKPKSYEFNMGDFDLCLSGFPCERKSARDRFVELLAACGWYKSDAKIKLLCIHQTIQGAKVGPSDYTFRSGKDVIRRKDLPQDATAILCGHIHRRQVLGNPMKSDLNYPLVIYPGSTERTSFAEKDEKKGFYELIFSEVMGFWKLVQLEFIGLPARPMVDLHLDGTVTAENLADYIQSRITGVNPDSIIRLKCSQDTSLEVIGRVSGKFLREILPVTMNYQFSADFRQRLISRE
jgi:exonuclease SbcD